jgi:DNA invertase Pin-like site-specific DNA recombinase
MALRGAPLCAGDSVFGYVRVSGDEQADRGLPVAGQREALQRYCAENKLHLVQIFVDEAISGGSDNRPAFRELMRQAHEVPGPVRAIVLWNWSRFARDQDDAHYWKASLRRQGVEIITTDGAMPVVQGFEYVLESLIHWKDEQRRHEISDDSRRGQQALSRMGFVPSGCHPPPGYRVEFVERELEGRLRQLRRWVPDPQTWPQVRRAWDMRLRGATYREIVSVTRVRQSAGSMATLFRHTIYRGEICHGGVVIPVEPMVSPEEWALVNAARRSPAVTGAVGGHRKARTYYMLAYMIRCARCGAPMTGSGRPGYTRKDGTTAPYKRRYHCKTRAEEHSCDMPLVSADAIEHAVIDALFDTVLTRENLRAQYDVLLATRASGAPEMESQLANARSALASAQAAVSNLVTAIESGAGSVPTVVRRLADRQEALLMAEAELQRVEARVGSVMEPPSPEPFRAKLRAALLQGDPAIVNRVLANIIVAVHVDVDTFRIEYRAPFLDEGDPSPTLKAPEPDQNGCIGPGSPEGAGTFHGDPEGINQFAACGAHIGLFTTGCGSTTGGLIPVIKVIANPNRMALIRDNADLDATPIIRGERTVAEMGQALYDEILAVARGKLTKSEMLGHWEA